MLPEKAEFVPIASLEFDFAFNNLKEAATPESERIFPFQYGPIAIFENVFYHAHHIGQGEFIYKHLVNGRFAHNGLVVYLVVNGVFMVEISQCLGIGTVKGLYPVLDNLFGSHEGNL